MKIAIAADHAGFALKEKLRRKLADEGHEVVDFGTDSTESCDYPDFASPWPRSGAGPLRPRRPGLLHRNRHGHRRQQSATACAPRPRESEDEVRLTREHNDANVLTLGAKYLDEAQAMDLIDIFLNTEFAGGRHARAAMRENRRKSRTVRDRRAHGGN